MRRLRALMRKEFIHMLRDPRTLVFIFLMPVLQLLLLGFAANTDIKYVPTAVFDQDNSAASRQLLDAFRVTDYYSFDYVANSQTEIDQLIESGKVKLAIIIPPTFHSDLTAGRTAEVAVLVDGSDTNTAGTILSATTFIGQSHGAAILAQKLVSRGVSGATASPIDVRARVLYNPDLQSSYNLIPGLIAMILMMTTTNLTSLSIVKERERGTIEQLIVTPIRSWELVVAKITPYILVAFMDAILILAVGTLGFGVPIRGSLVLLLLVTSLYILPNLGIGLTISTFAHTQQEAQFMTMPIMLPSMMLSGFLFPLASMPVFLQVVGNFLPLTYYIYIIRGIVIKGVSIEMIYSQIAILLVIAVVLLAVAALRFRKSLD
jgi:ABC-2 type transport system permease protein